MISPLAPHLAEELWKLLGYKNLVSEQKWPRYKNKFLTEENINLIVQINGKKKLLINIKKGLTKEELTNITNKLDCSAVHMIRDQKLKSCHQEFHLFLE